jgi:hypothetical protein
MIIKKRIETKCEQNCLNGLKRNLIFLIMS